MTAMLLSVHAEGSSRVFGSTETSTIPRTVAEQELLVPLYALVLGLTGAIVIVVLLLSIFALSAFSQQIKASAPKAATTAPVSVPSTTTVSAPPPSASPIRQAMATTTAAKVHAQSEEKEQLQSQPQSVAVKATRKLRVSHHVGAEVQMTASTLPFPSTSASASASATASSSSSFASAEIGTQGSKSVVSLGTAGLELDREFPHTTPTHRAVQRKLRVDLSGGTVRTYSISPTRK
jgi:hypothetical protein